MKTTYNVGVAYRIMPNVRVGASCMLLILEPQPLMICIIQVIQTLI